MTYKLKNFIVRYHKFSGFNHFKTQNWVLQPSLRQRRYSYSQRFNRAASEESTAETSNPPYLIDPNKYPLSLNPLRFWKLLLKKMWLHNQDVFRDSVKCQVEKRRLPEKDGSSFYEIVDFLEESEKHTVAVDLSEWPFHYICVDIDISLVGSRILELMSLNPKLARSLFGFPFIVKTKTPGHLHLFYSASDLSFSRVRTPTLVKDRYTFKKFLPTRLGFKAEYITGVVTLAGHDRVPVFLEPLKGTKVLSPLPISLYPYNFYKNDNIYTIIEKNTNEKGEIEEKSPSEGRNDRLFNFFRIYKFPENHLLVVNFICFENPMSDKEVHTIHKSISSRKFSQDEETYNVFSLELSERPGPRKPSPEFINIDDQRYKKAIGKGTKREVIDFINFIEGKFDTSIQDNQWMGRSYDYVIAYILLNKNLIQLFYILEENTYVFWDKKQWLAATENEVVDYSYKAALALEYGGIEERIARRTIITPLKTLCTIPRWQPDYQNFGYNFDSSIVALEGTGRDTKLKFYEHDPKFMHRETIKVDWDNNKCLSLEAFAVLSDMTFGSNYLFLVLRYCFFLVVNHDFGNLAYIFYGPGGAGKSILTSFLRKLLPFNLVGTIDDNLLTKAVAAKSTLVKNKSLILLPDITNKSLSAQSVEFIKVLTGRDPLATDAKYKDAQNFVSSGFLIATTNTAPLNMNAFKDSGFNQRFVQYPLPAVLDSERIPEVASILWENRFSLLYWGLSIDQQFVRKNLRADAINAVNSFELSELETFFLERTVFSKDAYITTKELSTAYGDYKKELGTSSEEKANNYTSLIGRALPEFTLKLVRRQAVVYHRYANKRGFKNITFKATSGKLKPDQEVFKFKQDPELISQLNQNPFQDHGFLITKSSGPQKQCSDTDLMAEAYNSVSLMAVTYCGLSAAQATRQRPLSEKPFSHLYNPLADYSNSKRVYDCDWFHFYKSQGCLVDLRDPNQKDKLLDQKDLEPKLNKAALIYWSFLVLKKSALNVLIKSPDMDPRLTLARRPTMKLSKEEIKKALDPATTQTKGESTSKLSSKRGRPRKKQDSDPSPETQVTKEAQPQVVPSPTPPPVKPFNDQEFDISGFPTGVEVDLNGFARSEAPWFFERKNLDEISHLNECLNLTALNIRQDKKRVDATLQKSFERCLEQFRGAVEYCSGLVKGFEFFTRYTNFQQPYREAEDLNKFFNGFLLFPLVSILPFINVVNFEFGSIFLSAWALNASSRKRDPSDYFNKILSGTSLKTQQENLESTRKALQPRNFDTNELEYVDQGWSLFPFLYQKGEASYGRFQALPNPGLSGLKAEVKHVFLKFIAGNSSKLNFVELDIKACHTTIALAFINQSNTNLPTPQNLWPTLTNQFKEALSRTEQPSQISNPVILDNLRKWSEAQIKALLKTQWYKALNNGNVYQAFDNLDRDRVKFNIPKEDVKDYARMCEIIFKQMSLFVEVTRFQTVLTSQAEIWLPTSQEPFQTKTLSRNQMEAKTSTNFSMTAMSRLLTSCESIVVAMISLAIANTKVPLMPVSYESDGWLVVGEFTQEDLPDLVMRINQRLSQMVNLVFTETFEIEYKKPT